MVLGLCVSVVGQLPPRSSNQQITVVQLSDTHIGDTHAPHAADNLRRAVEMANDLHPDAVIVSGDIGESPKDWEEAKGILGKLHADVHYAPGNHDVHSRDLERYRGAFGKDYYQFDVKFATFVVIDSELLGNYDVYESKTPLPLSPESEDESQRMFAWLDGLRKETGSKGEVVIGVQHIPAFRDEDYPPDTKPYWVISEPYRSREMNVLRKLGIKHMLVGHWHNGRVFEREGITWHVAPATSWLPWGGKLGFAVHHINLHGDVQTEFVSLRGAVP